MAKIIYRVGEPCRYCKTPTIEGKDGNGYCKPCYIAWKDKQKKQEPAADQSLVETFKKISNRFAEQDLVIKGLETRIKSLEEIQIKAETGDQYFPQTEDAKITVGEIDINQIPF